MEKGLVSIITPCFNSARYVNRLLDSILAQDYTSLELIVIDDGSSDNTFSILESYRPRFESCGIPYSVLRQENSGQSVAINNALKKVRGEYLVWPDSDDFYNRKDAISLFVDAFRSLPVDFGMVKTLPRYVDESGIKDLTGSIFIDRRERQFEQALFDRFFIWPPGLYMIKVSVLDTVNPLRNIYTEKKAGQNWQMVLPLLYSYKCYTLEENVFSVLQRKGSHSRPADRSIMSQLERIEVYERTILNTLDRILEMPEEERGRYKKAIRVKYARQKLYVSNFYADKERATLYKTIISNNGGHLSLKEFVRDLLMRINLYPLKRN